MNDPGDPRIGDIINSPTDEHFAAADVVIFGVPTDEGIIRNGGRPGAAQAPDAIRSYLRKLTPISVNGESLDSLRMVDLGNVSGTTLDEIHENAKNISANCISKGKIVIALGGGHDVTYPLAAGFAHGLGTPFSLVNVDAHLDVRPKKNGLHHSGSSFRLLIEEGILEGQNFIEFGIQSFAFSDEHYAWAQEQQSSVMLYDTIANRIISTFESVLDAGVHYLSFDIDSIRSADAPGCSAPSPIGLSAYEACEIARRAGASGVQMFDIVEVSPPHDLDGRTSRLAARMIAYFLSGLLER